MTAHPKVSVVMSVYNAEPFLKESIESILGQTYTNFEFIIINDGSTDGTESIIKSYDDKRIRLVSRENKGLVASLNEGVGLATGTYIARQDGDDISLPDRLEKQVAAFAAHKKLVLCGCEFSPIDEASQQEGMVTLSHSDPFIRLEFYVRNPFCHGSLMYPKKAVGKNPYSDAGGPTEDAILWRELAKQGELANIPGALYLYRINSQSISALQADTQKAETQKQLETLWSHPYAADEKSLARLKQHQPDEYKRHRLWLAKAYVAMALRHKPAHILSAAKIGLKALV